MLISLLILAVAVIATTFLSRSISQPIVRLTEATTRIRNLDLDDETTISSPIREIQLMEDAVSAMKTGLRSFRRYVPATLVRQLIETGEDARLGGQTRELTLLFSDVTDFTARSEGMPPQELMVHLSEYLDEITRLIIEHGGTVDKYMGDGIMAFWGAPARDEQHAVHACRAALAGRARLGTLNPAWEAQGTMCFPTRWGIHTGETVVGNVGSAERMNYSAVGDGVNFASRLEAVNKVYGTSIIVSEATRDSAGDAFVYRPLGAVAVKGKQESVSIFELICNAADPSSKEAGRLVMLFEAGLQLYLRREWTAAAEAFERAMATFPADGPAAVYLQRCNELIQTPPGPDWDGVLRLEHK
jgi:adenylate cyclase